jgi:hypothetical protein
LRFGFHWEYGNKFGEIIDKGNIIFVITLLRYNLVGTYIRVNDFARLAGPVSSLGFERFVMHLGL